MTRNDTAKILTVLKAAYPQFYKGMNREEAESVIALWSEMFSSDPIEIVAIAVKALIATDVKGFPPHIGAVKEQIQRLKRGAYGVLTEQEAWAIVRKAIGIYDTQERFYSLSPLLQKLVGSPNTLREWAMMDAATLDSVVCSNFMRSYKARAAHETDMQKLPYDVRKLMSNGSALGLATVTTTMLLADKRAPQC